MTSLWALLCIQKCHVADRLIAESAACPVWSDQQAGAACVSGHLRHLPLQDPDPRAGEGWPHQVLAYDAIVLS